MKRSKKILLTAAFVPLLSTALATKCEDKDNNGSTQNQPTTVPSDPLLPKKPDESQPEPSKPDDTTNNNDVSFSDIESLSKSLKIANYSYSKLDPKTALNEILKDESIFFKDVFGEKVLELYTLKISSESVNYDFDNGLLIDLSISFTKKNVTKTFIFTVAGFKKKEQNSSSTNKKENYISAKEPDEKIKGLFPSLIARMLLYIDNPERYNDITSSNKVNYEALLNANGKYFSSDTIPFGPGTKEAFFAYDKNLKEEYIDKIVAAGYDDSAGTLQLEVEIKNNPEKNSNEPSITKTFSFAGLKKADLQNTTNNVIGFSLTPMSFKNLQIIKSILSKRTKDSIKAGENILKDIEKSQQKFLKQKIVSELNVYINDSNKAYQDGFSQTAKVLDLPSLGNSFVLYPFFTWISNESIFDLKLELANGDTGKLKLSFNIKLPVFAQGIGDLKDYSNSNNKQILIPVFTEAKIDQFTFKK
ncbi:Hypothetical protein, predicted lipoprotein [Mycoplasmopsis agalactiae 14628]|uniref:Uncharacterized protein n=1 Tax=Mycoplasmopsis agalactiae 14628 TaxID=1110504 RepID=I5D5M2_MYCAA|nr:LppA family lipoprotein [Mycoplasmopsis agalactiae]EIN14981.1 Hypothetical protein, predicted lipoprotein [Mycoplasmopsis agalactiae 14628]